MIYLEFEDREGNVITETDLPLPEVGTARMWILKKDFKNYHKSKLKIGTKGYFIEGARKVGECIVIELIDLK